MRGNAILTFLNLGMNVLIGATLRFSSGHRERQQKQSEAILYKFKCEKILF